MQVIFRICLLATIFLPLTLSAQSPYGKWNMSGVDGNGQSFPIVVNFLEAGEYTVDFGGDGTIDIKGKLVVENGTLSVQDYEASDPSMLCTAKGVYTFKTESDKLTIIRVSDDCPGRGGPVGEETSMTKVK